MPPLWWNMLAIQESILIVFTFLLIFNSNLYVQIFKLPSCPHIVAPNRFQEQSSIYTYTMPNIPNHLYLIHNTYLILCIKHMMPFGFFVIEISLFFCGRNIVLHVVNMCQLCMFAWYGVDKKESQCCSFHCNTYLRWFFNL